jgi:hypothetical protein
LHYYELVWNQDLDRIFRTLSVFYISMPSIIDKDGSPRLPAIFNKIEQAYENPHNTHKQALWLDRISNLDKETEELLILLDRYNLHHNIEFFHNSSYLGIVDEFLPHQHVPGSVVRSITKDGNIIDKYTGSNPGELETPMQTVYAQLTFPFINANMCETQWSATYNLPFEKRRHFKEEEITGRYTFKNNPVIFDVMTWHSGKRFDDLDDRILFGCPSKDSSFFDCVERFKLIQN